MITQFDVYVIHRSLWTSPSRLLGPQSGFIAALILSSNSEILERLIRADTYPPLRDAFRGVAVRWIYPADCYVSEGVFIYFYDVYFFREKAIPQGGL